MHGEVDVLNSRNTRAEYKGTAGGAEAESKMMPECVRTAAGRLPDGASDYTIGLMRPSSPASFFAPAAAYRLSRHLPFHEVSSCLLAWSDLEGVAEDTSKSFGLAYFRGRGPR